MTHSWEDHQKLLAELDQQRIEREAREARERQEAEEAPLREQALELAKSPVDLTRYRNERNLMWLILGFEDMRPVAIACLKATPARPGHAV